MLDADKFNLSASSSFFRKKTSVFLAQHFFLNMFYFENSQKKIFDSKKTFRCSTKKLAFLLQSWQAFQLVAAGDGQ
jgi:hypothetical protein